MYGSYPFTRLRRLRQTQNIRNLFQENDISVNDLVYPVFIVAGEKRSEAISSMPSQHRLSIDVLLKNIPTYLTLGIKALALFPVIEFEKTVDSINESFNPNGLIPEAIRAIKLHFPEIIIFTDIALDPYTFTGHDGVTDVNNYVLNDVTNTYLVKQALVHAEAGADFVCPSDMMDGRIGEIRQVLEKSGYHNTGIMAYSVKYASGFYGPFRDAVSAAKGLGKSGKNSYQMNPANVDEAIYEVALDIAEGADIIMVKPGLAYLDVLCKVKHEFRKPTAVYHVSGEYAMLKGASQNNWLDYDTVLMETMLAFKRAGADMIWTYAALDVAKLITQ